MNSLRDMEVNMPEFRRFDGEQHSKQFAIVTLFSFGIVEYICTKLVQCTGDPYHVF